MQVEQPELGNVGVDTFGLTLDWHWEGGWSLRTNSRLSGSQTFTSHRYEALSPDEALELAQTVVAEALGLV